MSDYIRKQDVIDLINGLDSLPWEEETKEIVDTLPTLDETEIIRKAFERVVERLEELENMNKELAEENITKPYSMGNSIKSNMYIDRMTGVHDSIEIVKEECGINE
jgi:hypothetical protein